jgi:hypothetical protein
VGGESYQMEETSFNAKILAKDINSAVACRFAGYQIILNCYRCAEVKNFYVGASWLDPANQGNA